MQTYSNRRGLSPVVILASLCTTFFESTQTTETPNSSPTFILYNRVPKCGSSALKSVLNPLGDKNGFVPHDSLAKKPYLLMDLKENELKKKIESLKNNTLFTEHTHFVNLDNRKVAYINLIRDPIQRVNSAYCYERDRTKKFGQNQIRNRKLNSTRTLGQCIQESSIQNCVNNYNLFITIKYFCGSHPSCLDANTDTAMDRAIANLDQFYSVVGVVEQMEKTLVVTEDVLPEFFKGAVQRYEELKGEGEYVKNKCLAGLEAVQDPGDPVYRKHKKYLEREYRVYNHVLSKLEQQYKKIRKHLDL